MQPPAETLFIPGSSRFHRLHPFNKLAHILVTGAAAYLLPGQWHAALALVVINGCLAVGCGLFSPCAKTLWRIIFPLALFMIPIHTTLYPGNLTPLAWLGSVGLYREGLGFALDMILKVAALVAASLLFVFTTHPADLITAISRATGSPGLAYLIGSPLLLLPSVRQRVTAIQSAQQARGMETQGNLLKRIIGLPPLVLPLVLGALTQIEQRAIALELKGFNAPYPKTFLRQVPDSDAQKRARQGMLLVTGAIIAARFIGR